MPLATAGEVTPESGAVDHQGFVVFAMNRMRIRNEPPIVVANDGGNGVVWPGAGRGRRWELGQDLQIIVVAGSSGSREDQRDVADGLKWHLCVDLIGRHEQNRHRQAVHGETAVGKSGGQRHFGGGHVDGAELLPEYSDQSAGRDIADKIGRIHHFVDLGRRNRGVVISAPER